MYKRVASPFRKCETQGYAESATMLVTDRNVKLRTVCADMT